MNNWPADLPTLITELDHASPSLMVVPVISTAHVTAETMALLNTRERLGDLTVLGRLHDGVILYGEAEDEPAIGVDITELLAWMRSHGFVYCRLSSDGDVVDGLTHYEW